MLDLGNVVCAMQIIKEKGNGDDLYFFSVVMTEIKVNYVLFGGEEREGLALGGWVSG